MPLSPDRKAEIYSKMRYATGPKTGIWREPGTSIQTAIAHQQQSVTEFEGSDSAVRLDDPRRPEPRKNWPTHVTSAPELTRSGLPRRKPLINQ